MINERLVLAQTTGASTWRAYAGINNLFERHHAGPVIVGDTNGRSFDPALGRNWFVRGSVDVRL